MDSWFTLCSGLALFLYGMLILSGHLEQLAGSRLQRLLGQLTSSLPKSLLLGAGITIALQSSSALTVMLVSLVNAGVMTTGQTLGMIMGSNIGTTLTPWLLALTGVEGASSAPEWLQNLSAPLAVAGVFLLMLSSRPNRWHAGHILLGFSLLMLGMERMSEGAAPLTALPQFTQLLSSFENPLLGLLGGALFTGLVQSSAASVGILQTLAQSGSITYAMAIPVVIGQNIGTCVTALLASIGTSRGARTVARLHLSFNLFGAAVWMLPLLQEPFRLSFLDAPVQARGIALCHTLFNLLTTLLLLPLLRPLERRLSRRVFQVSRSTR